MNSLVSYSNCVGSALWMNNLIHGLAGLTIKVKNTMYCQSSPFQKIEVFDTYRYGMVLSLGGSIVMTEHDGDVYHEMMVHPAMLSHAKLARICM